MRVIVFILFLSSISVSASTDDSLRIDNLQREVNVLMYELRKQNEDIQSLRLIHQTSIDSFAKIQAIHKQNVDLLGDKVNAGLSETNDKIDKNVDSLSHSMNVCLWGGIVGFLCAVIALCCIYFFLRKKITIGNSSIDKIKSVQETIVKVQKEMQEESVKLDHKLIELMDKQFSANNQPQSTNEIDHSFTLKVADEITRIELNLSRMDSTIKGYKQLSKAVERIKSNFLANGYEIVDMLGKPYNEGMKVVANIVTDETIKEGEQIITGIIKPQINYKGQVIQTAQITVSQNL